MATGMGLVSKLKALVGPRAPKIDLEGLRRARPIARKDVDAEPLEDGGIILAAPLEAGQGRFTKMLARWSKAPTTKKFELEPVGAYVWTLCDGQHTVDGISRKLQSRYRMNRLEADAALSAFLRMLSQRGLIDVMVAKK